MRSAPSRRRRAGRWLYGVFSSVSSGGGVVKGAQAIGARDEAVRGGGVDDGGRRRVQEAGEPVGQCGLVGCDSGLGGGGDQPVPAGFVVHQLPDARLRGGRAFRAVRVGDAELVPPVAYLLVVV